MKIEAPLNDPKRDALNSVPNHCGWPVRLPCIDMARVVTAVVVDAVDRLDESSADRPAYWL